MRAGRLFLFGALILSVSATAGAHELGTLRTFVAFHKDGSFAVELIVDREHLPPRFGENRPSKEPVRIEGLTPVLDRQIGGILSAAVRGARPAFDGRPVATKVALARSAGESDASVAVGAELRLILSGTIPPG